MEEGEGCYRSKIAVFRWMLCWNIPSLPWNQRVSITKKKKKGFSPLEDVKPQQIRNNQVLTPSAYIQGSWNNRSIHLLYMLCSATQIWNRWRSASLTDTSLEKRCKGNYILMGPSTVVIATVVKSRISQSFGSCWPKFWTAQQPCQIHLVCVNVPILCSTIS